jgi:hypothetical protein
VLLLTRCLAVPLFLPQIQLGFFFHQAIERERHAAYCQALRIRQNKSPASGIGELTVERRG